VRDLVTGLGRAGPFVPGMGIMTGALRKVAGRGLRRSLVRLTASPLSGVATGADHAARLSHHGREGR